jgi:alkylhydroperoxidase family enzyme
LAKQQGLEETLVEQLADYENGPFTRAEKLALRLAETIAYNPNGVDPELAAALREEFTDAQIAEIGFATAMFFGAGRFVAAMGLTLAEDREPVPVRAQTTRPEEG